MWKVLAEKLLLWVFLSLGFGFLGLRFWGGFLAVSGVFSVVALISVVCLCLYGPLPTPIARAIKRESIQR